MADDVPGNLTEEQILRLKEDIPAQFQGAVNAGRPLLLEGGLKWQQMAFSPSDMDFINTKHVAAREIALAFGVPPMLLGIPGDNTYANYQEANRAFWRLTLLPLVDRVLGSLGRWLGDEAGDLRLEADRDRITALAVERDALWARLGSAAFMTTNEKRAEVGLDLIDGGEGLGLPEDKPDVTAGAATGMENVLSEILDSKAGPKRHNNQPRAPKGHEDGGQWTDGGGGGASSSSNEGRPKTDAATNDNADTDTDTDGEAVEDQALTSNEDGLEADVEQDITGATAPAPVKRGDQAILNDECISTVIFNETISFAGDGIIEARRALAHAILNGDEGLGKNRPITASSTIDRGLGFARVDGVGDINEPDVLEEIRRNVVGFVRRERSEGNDAVEGAIYFGFRDLNKFPIGGIEALRTSRRGIDSRQIPLKVFGPFKNALPTETLGKEDIYIVIFMGGPGVLLDMIRIYA